MKTSLLGLLVALTAFVASLTGSARAAETYRHGGQFGLRASLVGAYNMNFRYDQSPLCSAPEPGKPPKDQQKFCGNTAPLMLDLAASYALLDFVEPYAFLRLGLKGEKETATNPLTVLGVGARIYTMSESAFKIFIEPAVAWELEGGAGGNYNATGYNPKYKKDLLLHLAAGPQIDLARYVGLYGSAGLTTGILRSIHTQLELSLGVQARFP